MNSLGEGWRGGGKRSGMREWDGGWRKDTKWVGEQDGRVRQSEQGGGGWEDEGGRWGRGRGTGQLGWVISATMFLQTARMGTNLKVILEVISEVIFTVIFEVILDLVGDVQISGRH